ncbi:MAG: excinuclease ABC subunit UvrC [Chitinophagaceae bacterium]|nr:excinuclease ABC subunit UvrC [Oligoflexus sp.]
MSTLAEKLKQLPQDAGVYLMKDKKGTIIYVGKAKNLKNRVSSYFQSSNQHTYKTRTLVSEICDFDLMLVQNEVEALLLERTLIRHHMPRFNILLRDDKEYPFLRICYEDPWPRIVKVRKRKDDSAHYIGPFSSSSRLNVLLRQVYKIFPLIRCSAHEFKTAKRPCNYYHMKMCLGPCTLPVDRKYYISLLKDAASLLEGNVSKLRRELEQKMKAAAKGENYELAAQLRDQIQAIDHISQQQVAILDSTVDADIIGVTSAGDKRSFNVTMVRNRTMLGGDHFIVESSAGLPAEEMTWFILQYYTNKQVPALVLLRDTTDLDTELASVICQQQDTSAVIRQIKKGEEADLLDISERNAMHQLEAQENQKNQQQLGLQLLQETLELPRWPERIECIDISNLQGTAIVASDVCFVNGKPAKEFYRRYEVKTVVGAPDDFASMQEIVKRRIERALRDDDLPDLLIIDGGRPQVRAVMEVVDTYPDLNLPIVGLAKSRLDKGRRDDRRSVEASKERLVLPHQEEPIELVEGGHVFRLVTRIRDEAHRFAITYHRKKRQGISHASVLDEVTGIGPALKKRLLIEFGTIQGIADASLERLMSIKGVSEKTALNLHTTLRAKDT